MSIQIDMPWACAVACVDMGRARIIGYGSALTAGTNNEPLCPAHLVEVAATGRPFRVDTIRLTAAKIRRLLVGDRDRDRTGKGQHHVLMCRNHNEQYAARVTDWGEAAEPSSGSRVLKNRMPIPFDLEMNRAEANDWPFQAYDVVLTGSGGRLRNQPGAWEDHGACQLLIDDSMITEMEVGLPLVDLRQAYLCGRRLFAYLYRVINGKRRPTGRFRFGMSRSINSTTYSLPAPGSWSSGGDSDQGLPIAKTGVSGNMYTRGKPVWGGGDPAHQEHGANSRDVVSGVGRSSKHDREKSYRTHQSSLSGACGARNMDFRANPTASAKRKFANWMSLLFAIQVGAM